MAGTVWTSNVCHVCSSPSAIRSEPSSSGVSSPARLCRPDHRSFVSGAAAARPGCSVRTGKRREPLVVAQAARGPPGGAGDPASKSILEAFFLGRALAETVNERLGSAVGELLSDISKRQAEQREQTRQFQEEVKERARAAMMKAAAEAQAKDQYRPYPPPPPSSEPPPIYEPPTRPGPPPPTRPGPPSSVAPPATPYRPQSPVVSTESSTSSFDPSSAVTLADVKDPPSVEDMRPPGVADVNPETP